MRYSCAAFRILQKRYVSVLKKCALINAGLFFLAAPAMASDWSDFVAAVTGGQTEIDISEISPYVDRILGGDGIGLLGNGNSGTYLITGGEGYNLTGNRGINGYYYKAFVGDTYADPIEVVAGQTLTLHNINQYNFSQFITNNGGHVIIKQEGEYDSAYHNNTGTALANNGGTLTISGTDIYENGGGIANNGGTVNINSSSVYNNSGTAFINNNGTLTLTDSNIHDNTTGISNNGTVNITGGSLKDNEKQAIYNNGTLHISGTTISNNSGKTNQDAAIYNNGGTVYINGATFSDNTSYNGGALANVGGMVVIENSTFDGNHATGGNGGAIDTWGGTTTIIDSTFTNNHANDSFNLTNWANGADGATTYGGGAINNNDRGTLNIVAQNDDVEFTGNYVGNSTDYALAITNNGTINLNASAGHSIVFNDAIGYSQGSSRETNIININKSEVELKNSAGETIATPTDGTIEINNYVFDQTVNMYGGTLKFGKEGYIDATENHHSNLNVYGGSIDTINGEAGYTGVGWVTAYNDIDFALDADASINFADHYDAQGHYKPEIEDARLYISKISILNSTDNRFVGEAVDTENNNGSWEWFNVRENAELVDGSGDKIEGNTLVAWNKETGILKAGKYNLKNAVSDNATVTINAQGCHRENVKVDENSDRVYRLEEDEIVTENLGDMTNGSLTIAGNDKKITAQSDKAIDGITVGTGDTLEINDVAAMQGFATALSITGGETTINNSTLSENDTALNVASGASVTLNDTNIKGNLTNGIINAGTVNLNATAGESAENKNTVTVDNTLGTTDAGTLENTGTLNLNAFANAIIDIKDKITNAVTGAASAIANNIVNINQDTAATGEVKLADIENQTVNIAQGTVTAGAISGSDVNITAGNVTAGNISSSAVTAESATDSLTIASVDNSTVTTSATKTEITGEVKNASTITNKAGSATIKGAVNASTVDVQGGTATLESDVKEKSEIKVATSASATIKGAVNASTVTTSGDTDISGAISNGSTITANAGTLDITNTVTGSTVTSKGTTTIAGAISGKSTVDVQAGETTISAAVTGSELKVSGGKAQINGTVDGSAVSTSAGETTLAAAVTDSAITTSGSGKTTVTADVSGTKNDNGTYTSHITTSGGTANLQGNVTGTTLAQSNTGTLNLGTEGKEISLAGSTIASGTANLTAATVTGGEDGAFTIAEKAALNTAQDATIAASINGNGTISATGNELTFSTNDNASGSAFAGAISAGNGATVNLDSSYGLSTDATVSLDNSILNYDTTQTTLSDASLFNIALSNGATANITGAGRDTHNIALSDKFWSVTEGSTGSINFNNAHYTLGTGFTTGTDSTATFNNADISLAGQDENSSFGNIALSNSALQLSNRKAGDEYKFGNLISENNSAEITLDVNLAYDTEDETSNPVADTIEYADGSSGELNITELFITDDNGAIGQAGTDGKTIQILKGDGSLKLRPSDGMEILSWATNVYEYGVESAKTEKEADSINIAMDRPSSTDTLRDLNRYIGGEGNTGNIRGFSFIAERDDEGNITGAGSYNIYRDLDATSAGTFTILGNDVNGSKSVLSGELEALTIAESSTRYEKKDDGKYTYYEAHEDEDGNKVVDTSDIAADKVTIAGSSTKPGENDITFAVGAMGNDTGEGARGSMFEIVNKTNFTIRNVSVENALRTGKEESKIFDGAAIYANNEKAEVTLENTDFKNNEVKGGNGGAIANIKSAVFNIANALFSGNKASANGGAIYNAAEMTLANAEFSGNTAANGGAIYNDTAGTMTINGATFENNATGTDGKGGAIYNAGTMTFAGEVTLAAATTAEDGTVTASNDIYNTGTLNLNGTTELNSAVTNDETLKVNGKTTLDNNISGTGDMFVNSSELELADTATIAQNTLTLAEAVKLTVNADQLKISEALNNAGTLTFTGGTNTSAIAGEGTLNITGNVINADTAEIEQSGLSIADNGIFTTLADLITLKSQEAEDGEIITPAIDNAGTLTFTGGKNANNIFGTGSLEITGDVINNEAEIAQNALTISGADSEAGTSASSLTTDADLLDINEGIDNAGTLTFTGGTNNNAVSGSGTTTISGTVNNEAKIEQGSLTIAEKDGSLTTNAGKLTIANSITNTGILTFTGGDNKNAITNNGTMEYQGTGTNTGAISGSEGTLNITGTVTNGEKATIAQKELAIAGAGSDAGTSAGSLTTNAGNLTITNGITNNGKLTFTGGKNANNISGTGSLNITGTVTNEAKIEQGSLTIAEKDDSLTTNADNLVLADNSITNNGLLTFTGGTNSNVVSGSGSVNISGEVGNKKNIEQNVSVADNGALTNSADISGTVTNAGTLDNTNGTISGDVTNSGTLTSAAEKLQGAIANNAGGALNLSGTLDKTISGAGTTNINGELAFESNADIEGTLNMNNGKLDLLGKDGSANQTTEHNIGKLTGTGTIQIDSDMSGAGSADKLIVGADSDASVTIDSINITKEHDTTFPSEDAPEDKHIQVIGGDGAGSVNLAVADNTATLTSDHYMYKFTESENEGHIKVDFDRTTAGLSEFIKGEEGADEANTYSMTRDETSNDDPVEPIGTTAERDDGSKEMNLNMNGHTLSGNGNDGITVAGDYTLNVNGSEGTVSNFNTAFTVEENGTLNLDSVIFEANQTDVANNGALNFSGNNLIEGGITGTGSTTITGGKTEVVASIEQGSLAVNTGATLEGSAANLTITNGITNAGTVNFTGGENKNNIANTGTITFGKDEVIGDVASNNGEISGTGTVNMTDGSANRGTIEQGTINIAANATVTNTGTMSADKALTVNTGATVTNTGGTLSGNIANAGTINSGTVSGTIANTGTISNAALSGKLDNDGTISGGSVTAAEDSVNDGTITAAVTADGNFTNNNKIEGSVTANRGTFTNAGGATISGMITNKGTLENLVNGKLYDVINSNIFANAGEVRDVTNNTGGAFTNTGTAGNVINAGTFENTGTIANLDNEKGAAATTALSGITGDIANDGILNLTDAEATLDKTISGAGTTSISGAVTLGENGGFAATQSLHVNEKATLDIATGTITLDNFTLKGQLNLAITDISANSSEYEGGKILVNSADLTGGKMQFTVGKGLLSGKQQTGELAIVDLKDGATGTIEGDLSDMFYDNNLYEISRGETAGTVIITNVATAQEVITGIGNQNQINTAGAWENIVTEDGTAVGDIQEALNTLVQHDIPQYLEALTNLAPTDSQFRLQNAKEAQNLIGRQIALRLDSGDCPTCKDPFRKTAMWMQGLGGYAKQDNRFDAAGYSAYTGGYAIGYDGNVNCDTTVGFGYAYTTTDGESHGRDMDVSAHNLFAYGKYQPSAWYLRGAFTYGAAKYDEKSDVAGHSVTAKYDVHYTGLEAALGHDFANGLTPEFGLRATHLMPDDYEDSLGQKVTNKDVFALSAAALLKYRNTYELNEYTVRPNVYAGLTYDLTDDGSNTAVRINEMNYDIIGKRLPRLGGEAGFAVEVSHDNIDLSVGYDMGYREDYISHTGMIKLRYNFN